MRKVSIFVAGSTELKEERELFKAVAQDINADLEPKGTQLSIRSYEHYGQNQKEYDGFIEQKADLVVFVLDGAIGEKTKDEFLLATKLLHSRQRPKVLVFLREFTNMDENLSYIKGLVDGATQEYWVTYSDKNDLKVHAEKQLRRFLAKCGKSPRKPSGSRHLARNLAVGAVCLCLCALTALGVTKLWPGLSTKPVLLITGGGSAANYVDLHYSGIKLNEYEGGIYVHMPSSDAWSLLTEEVISPPAPDKRRYYPVCLSAESAPDSCFLKAKSKAAFLKDASVVSVKLGMDTLAVYLKNHYAVTSHITTLDKKIITLRELASLISDNEAIGLNVFTTSQHSGTRHTYERALANCKFDLVNRKTELFAEESDLPTLNKDNKPYMLLGSTCYFAKTLSTSIRDGETLRLVVTDDSGRAVEKPIFLYFMAYCFDNGDMLEVPQPTLQLLKDLNVPLGSKVKDGKLKRNSEANVILNFTDLPNL